MTQPTLLLWAGVPIALFLFLAGIMMLRSRWANQKSGRYKVAAGWALIVAATIVLSHIWSGELGTSFGLLAISVIAYLIIAATVQIRKPNERAPANSSLEPEHRPTNWTRAIGKSLLAIVLAGFASIGLGVAFAVSMPMDAPDRIVIGGILVPVLWGAGMAWTLADAKLLRATIILLSLSAAGYGIAFLPKVIA